MSQASQQPRKPGDLLLKVLKAQNLSQAELGRLMGRPLKTINELVKGKARITPETALQLEKALGIPAEIWIGLETQHRLGLARQKENT